MYSVKQFGEKTNMSRASFIAEEVIPQRPPESIDVTTKNA